MTSKGISNRCGGCLWASSRRTRWRNATSGKAGSERLGEPYRFAGAGCFGASPLTLSRRSRTSASARRRRRSVTCCSSREQLARAEAVEAQAAPGVARRGWSCALGLARLRRDPGGDHTPPRARARRLVPARHRGGRRERQPARRRARRRGEGGPPEESQGAQAVRRGRPGEHGRGAQDGTVRTDPRPPRRHLLRARAAKASTWRS